VTVDQAGRDRVRVIWNPGAGSKAGMPTNRAGDVEIREALEAAGLPFELVSASDPEAIGAAARYALGAGASVVVAAGGDGTIALVASELLGTGVALGILPLGSVMNVPRSLGLPRDLRAAADVLAAGHIRTIDVGRVGEQRFFEAGSVGMHAAMFREANRFDDGDWSSVVRTVWVALRYRPARMELRLDDRVVRTRALMVSVAIGPYTGLAMQVAPDADLDDGRFDVRVFRGFSKGELLRHLAGIAFGRYRYAPHVSTYRSRRVAVHTAHPLPARADSHDLGHTPVTFEILPHALGVIAPA
jgi:diacylglycerol kinase (ATP)